jgi:hypothetical protein
MSIGRVQLVGRGIDGEEELEEGAIACAQAASEHGETDGCISQGRTPDLARRHTTQVTDLHPPPRGGAHSRLRRIRRDAVRELRPPPGLPGDKARAIAERAHSGQIEPSGRPYLHHVRRVAAAVPLEAEATAWLHDVVEWTDLDEEDLVAAGLSPQECLALRLLTRPDEPDDESFLSHVRLIALAPGPGGKLARLVKRADMEDRLRLPRDPDAAWRPPYCRALEMLASGGGQTTRKEPRR